MIETKICNKCAIEKDVCEFETNRGICKVCRKTYIDQWHLNNKDAKKRYDKKYQIKNFEKETKRKKNYYLNNKKKVYKYYEERKKIDPVLKLSINMRSRINIFFKLNKISKKNSTFDLVGCTPIFLREYIEKKFTEGMSWEKMGKHIHIDHIIPLSSAKTEEEVYGLCHYTNLQPLWAYDNLSKGDKIL